MTATRRDFRDDPGVIPEWLHLPRPEPPHPPALTEPLADGWRVRWPNETDQHARGNQP